jgi:hypothetical protein
MSSRVPCTFVPPYLLRQVATALGGDGPARTGAGSACARTLERDELFRGARSAGPSGPPRPPVAGAAWTVHTAGNGTTLPGEPVRSAGDPESGDPAVDEAAHGVAASLALFDEVFGHASYDGAGAPVSLTVHYGQDYANAFWDGTQLVFGDGDGRVFGRMTRPVDVLGHEFVHAVTQHTAGLVYRDQPGALNESVSDVFAACLEQRLRGQSPAEADWLIGSELFLPGVRARGLRDMAAPGTAYDDPVLGRDPQVGHLDDLVVTTDDNGGVHLNSGIPNRAFHLAAVAIGRPSWEGAGAVWWAALTSGRVGPETDFAGFAAATVAEAGEHADAVREAWAQVGVTVPARAPGPAGSPEVPVPSGSSGTSGSSGGPGVVSVRRSGGFAGRTTTGEVDCSRDDPRAAEVRDLVHRIDLAAAAKADGPAYPDMFTYVFAVDDRSATVPETGLTDDLRRLADLVLEGGSDPTR